MKLITILMILFGLLFFPAKNSFSAEYDYIKAELSAENWEQTWLQPAAIKKLSETPEALTAMMDLVSNIGLDWRIRIRGIRVLGETRSAKAGDFLVDLFYNPFSHWDCPAIKSNIAIVLGNFSSETRIVDALIAGSSDKEVQVREASISSLGKIGDARALDILLTRLSDNSIAVRMNTIKAVAQIGDKRAVPFLRALLDRDPDLILRAEAKSALTRLN